MTKTIYYLIFLSAVWVDPVASNPACELWITMASKLHIRTLPDSKSQSLGLLPRLAAVKACRVGQPVTLDSLTSFWFQLESTKGFVFGGYLTEALYSDGGPPLVYGIKEGSNLTVGIAAAPQQKPCVVDFFFGAGLGWNISDRRDYVALHYGTGPDRDLRFVHSRTCKIYKVPRRAILTNFPGHGVWKDGRFRYVQILPDRCSPWTEYEFFEGVERQTGKSGTFGPESMYCR